MSELIRFLCDRCGAEHGTPEFYVRHTQRNKLFHLCPECRKEFLAWLESKPEATAPEPAAETTPEPITIAPGAPESVYEALAKHLPQNPTQ